MNAKKRLSIHTTHEGVKKIFNCTLTDFLKEVSQYYKIPEHEIELYSANQHVSVYELKDMMHIEVTGKGQAPFNNRRLRSEGQSSKNLTVVETIIKKLKENTTLTGAERKYLIENLERDASSDTLKRKRSVENGILDKVPTANKKLQVCLKDCKDSFCQTDGLYKAPAPPNKAMLNEEMIEKMKHMAAEETYDKEEASELMLQSYNDRRTFLFAHNPPVGVFKEKYPLLFTLHEVKNELERITYTGNCGIFMKNIEKYADSILKLKDDDLIYLKTKKYMDRGKTDYQKNYARDVGSILLIPSILDEKLDFLKLSDNLSDPGKYPYISAETTTIKELFFDQSLFKIIVEEVPLCEATNFKEALLCLMASFFIFNIEYPDSCHRTCVVFEKLYLEANDTEEIDSTTQQVLKYLRFTAREKNSRDTQK